MPRAAVAIGRTLGGATIAVIQGLAVSMEACGMPIIVICGGILLPYLLCGLFGVAIAATSKAMPANANCRR